MCIRDRAKGIRELIDLDDPAGKVLRTVERPNGIVIEKTAVPMGVIAIIYESRPNVTSDAAAPVSYTHLDVYKSQEISRI